MKYYCKDCGSILIIPDGKHFSGCPVYGCNDPEKFDEENMVIIPDYETPEQYKERTGKQYPDDGAVWWFGRMNWFLSEYGWVVGEAKLGRVYPVVIACPPVPPPDNWKPEEK